MKKIADKVNFINILQILILVLIFSFPRTLQIEKIILLCIILVLGFFRNKIAEINFGNILIYIFIIIISVFVGMNNSNDFSEILNGIRLYFLFPFLLLLLLMFFTNEELEYTLKKSSFYSIIIITVVGFSSLLNGLGLFPININSYFYAEERNIGIHDGYLHIINSSLSSLIFLIPFYYSDLSKRINLKNPEIYILLFAFLISVLSSRRILLLPFIIIYLLNIKHLKYISIIVVLLLIYLFYQGIINPVFIETFIERLLDALNERGDSAVRNTQTQMFLKYINENPIYGHGIGAYMPDYLRNNDFKSAYEASFYYLVFVLGIPMSLVFFGYYFKLFKNTLYNKMNFSSFYRKGLFWGALCFLCASYTNPYWMSSFDFILPFVLLLRSAK